MDNSELIENIVNDLHRALLDANNRGDIKSEESWKRIYAWSIRSVLSKYNITLIKD